MAKQQDYLPEAERFIPATEAEAMLVFGELGTPEIPNFQPATDSIPGSWERIEVYRKRAFRREPIFNPNDRNDMSGFGVTRKSIDPIREILEKMEKRNS
jgi:hypothetical protein